MSKKKKLVGYVDGFVIPMRKSKIAEYKKIAKIAAKVWMEHGALDYFESIGDDLKIPMGVPFPKMAKAKSNETVVFAWITYASKSHRNSVNKKVMKDSRFSNMTMDTMPFDCRKMAYGGFKILVRG